MKKTILISVFVSSIFAYSFTFAAQNLWEYFSGYLPSISKRAVTYKTAGFTDVYRGTAEQNKKLLLYLEDYIILGALAFPPSTVEGTSTAGWTDDGSNVRLNTAADFVGIGTANPAEKLSVVGGSASVSGDISLSGGDLNIGGAAATSTLTRGTNGLGLGTTSPVYTFSVQGSVFISGTTTSGALNATSTLIASTTRFSGGPQFSWPQSDGTSGQLLQTNGAGTLSFVSSANSFTGLTDTQDAFTANRIIHTNSGATALTDTAGFVFNGSSLGISSTSPAQQLGLQGNALISGTTTAANLVVASSTLSVNGVTMVLPSSSGASTTAFQWNGGNSVIYDRMDGQQLCEQVLSAANATSTCSWTGSATDLKIVFDSAGADSGILPWLTFNTDYAGDGTNYGYRTWTNYGDVNPDSPAKEIRLSNTGTTTARSFLIHVINNSARVKQVTFTGTSNNPSPMIFTGVGRWNNTSAQITAVNIRAATAGLWDTGTRLTVYGKRN